MFRCPRCGVRRRRRALARHLWRHHRRLILRRHVVSVRRWLDDWAARAARSADPIDGLAALCQTKLRQELSDPDALPTLRMIAAKRGAAICPHCFALADLPPDEYPGIEPLRPLEISANRISGGGIVVARTHSGHLARIEILGPGGERMSAGDPSGPWRRGPATRRFVLPFVLLSLILSVTLPAQWVILGTAGALIAAYALRLAISFRAARESAGALIDSAWRFLARRPELAGGRWVPRLALSSRSLGQPSRRSAALTSLLRSPAAAPPELRWPIIALQALDAPSVGDDPAPILAEAVADILRTDSPLGGIEVVLGQSGAGDWPAGERGRLRALLLERAFAIGLGVWDLHELGATIPILGDVIRSADVDDLARLRLIWTLRKDRPWRRLGPAATAFELAAYPLGADVFASAPDALLAMPLSGWEVDGQPVSLIAAGRGLMFRGAVVTESGVIEQPAQSIGREFPVRIGSRQFQFDRDPTPLVRRLEAWRQFVFKELLPQAESAVEMPNGPRLERLLRSRTLICPECGGLFRGQEHKSGG